MIEILGTIDPKRHSDRDVHGIGGSIGTLTRRDYKDPKKVAIPIYRGGVQ